MVLGAEFFLQAFEVLFPKKRYTFPKIHLVFTSNAISSKMQNVLFYYLPYFYFKVGSSQLQHCNAVARLNPTFVVCFAAGWGGTNSLLSPRNSSPTIISNAFQSTKKTLVTRK